MAPTADWPAPYIDNVDDNEEVYNARLLAVLVLESALTSYNATEPASRDRPCGTGKCHFRWAYYCRIKLAGRTSV